MQRAHSRRSGAEGASLRERGRKRRGGVVPPHRCVGPLTELGDGTAPESATWSWEPVVVFEHALRLARTVPHYRGTVAKDVIGKVALGLVKSRFITARDERRSHSPIWSSNISGY